MWTRAKFSTKRFHSENGLVLPNARCIPVVHNPYNYD